MSSNNNKNKGTTSRRFLSKIQRFLEIFYDIYPLAPTRGLIKLFKYVRRTSIELEKEISDVTESLRKSSELISKLEDELKERSSKLTELQEQYERYSELSKIQENQVEAVLRQMGITVENVIDRQLWKDILIQVIIAVFFLLIGVFFSDYIKNLGNSFWTIVLNTTRK